MSIFAKAGSLLKRFRKSQEGQVALTFGLAALPMFLFAGSAIDYMRASEVRTRLQYALDSAALAAASSKNMSDAKRAQLAQDIFTQNWKASNSTKDLSASAKFEIKGIAVKGSASVDLPTAFMRIAGINNMDINGDVSISIPKGKKAEIALVLDYSWSMTETSGGQIKYVAMKEAAKALVNDLSKQAAGQVKIGLVPFSQQVRVTMPKKFVKGQGNAAGDWTGCTPDRLYPSNITDSTPTIVNEDTKWGQKPDEDLNADCNPFAARNLNVRPLSTDFAAVNAQLDAMKPFDYTHVALGAEFGWHILSPNEPFAQGAAYNDTETQKVMVILSDGRQTVKGYGKSSHNIAAANSNFLSICSGAKAKGIRIMTIAFDMADQPDAQARMRSCSSDPKKDYYEPESGSEVSKVFEEIKTQVASSVFISD